MILLCDRYNRVPVPAFIYFGTPKRKSGLAPDLLLEGGGDFPDLVRLALTAQGRAWDQMFAHRE